MWEELTGRSGRRLTEMTGKRYSRTQLVCDSRARRTLYVPLPFWFSQHSGHALALCSLQFHAVQLQIQWESLEKLIVVSAPGVQVKNCLSACCLSANDLSACIESCYIYLDTHERDKFATQSYEILVVQNQSYSIQAQSSSVRVLMAFNHPVIELIWGIRRQCQDNANNWFNYSGIDSRDPLKDASLTLNNQQRFAPRSGPYFRLVQPWQHHSCIPESYVYSYSFALHPEDPNPSGSCNMSRIDNVEMHMNLQPGLGRENVNILVFARNWNVLRFKEGLAGLAYAN
jgi:hypothetical protein